MVLGKDTNPSAETIGRGGCFVLESLVLFYDKLYLKAFNEKKNLFMDSFDTKCQWWMVSCCPRPWLSLLSYINTCMWLLERIEIFHVYWEEKMSQIWNIWFLVLTSTSKSRLYCVYKGHLIGNCSRGPTLELKHIFSSQGNWGNRSALALVKWSMKSSLKKKCNCTQLVLERQERGASDFTCGCEQISQGLLVSVSQAAQWFWHVCMLWISKDKCRNLCAKYLSFVCRKEAHRPHSQTNAPKLEVLNAGMKQ